jgi:hypothetical protein
MLVITDTSPLHYLVLIDHPVILPALFRRVLDLAAERELLDFPTAITKLQATSFHMPLSLVREMLTRDAARKSRPQN